MSCKDYMDGYFKEMCAPGINGTERLKNCYEPGEQNALKSLADGKSDVAFVSMRAFNEYKANQISGSANIGPLCPEDNKMYCFMSWSNIGHIFSKKNLTAMRRQEIINVFTKLDKMFGKHPPFHTPMFSMYGPFNHKLDVLFHNNTRSLALDNMLINHPYDKIPMNFERQILNVTDFACDFGAKSTPSLFLILASLVAYIFYS
ncbi:hypothetical protein O3G_MSEX012162 [Manduca sexta]|uniref:Transferrin-like domain-containing protein n=2 Tax=Manduca sexta TaxID=7130 RepID=A0A922CWB7_MANSE|nr:hypothetical protein O3G_MSEX012162 [Manduca sexta]KAG6460700.1 hypothetical protein O3G_MSEX012162 [Manduca sexta]